MNEIGQNTFSPGMTSFVFVPDSLIANSLQLVTESITIASGQGVLLRGTILGQVTAGGNYKKSVKTATDGSQVPSAILIDNVDATGADVQGGGYLMGEFNQHHIIFDDSWTVPTLSVALRPFAIFLRDSLQASNT